MRTGQRGRASAADRGTFVLTIERHTLTRAGVTRSLRGEHRAEAACQPSSGRVGLELKGWGRVGLGSGGVGTGHGAHTTHLA
jgi:hypothetical protein